MPDPDFGRIARQLLAGLSVPWHSSDLPAADVSRTADSLRNLFDLWFQAGIAEGAKRTYDTVAALGGPAVLPDADPPCVACGATAAEHTFEHPCCLHAPPDTLTAADEQDSDDTDARAA